MKPPAALLQSLGASFWFLPALMLLGSMAAAVLLVEVDTFSGDEWARWAPRLFGASAEGSRAMLSAIATSMITVAGVVFSITIVVLSQASTQYSPRVLRNFMRDRFTQAVLGVFVGVFAYCLMVLRTVRGGDGAEGFIPATAVLVGMAYAFAAIGMLVFFIHHIATSIQASTIAERIAHETRHAIDHLFPEDLGDAPEAPDAGTPLPDTWVPVRARRSGYVVRIDADAVLRWAVDSGRVLRLRPALGEFVAEDAVLLDASGDSPVPDKDAERLRRAVLLDSQRTPEQDAGFGLQQLVDVAVKALSPGINDPTTASICIDRLGALLGRLAARRMPGPHRSVDGRLRVIAPVPDFDSFVTLTFTPLLAHSRGDLQVLGRLADALRVAADRTSSPRRRAPLLVVVTDMRAELAGAKPASMAAAALGRLDRLERRLLAAAPRPDDRPCPDRT